MGVFKTTHEEESMVSIKFKGDIRPVDSSYKRCFNTRNKKMTIRFVRDVCQILRTLELSKTKQEQIQCV